jgi:CheY-like chemotaxis protein/HPt (histidine-containing phosphotransfer) domain-containing protein
LLVEDTPANQKVIAGILRKRGHRVTLAANGREAVECFRKARFDAILMDVQMPVMDGYQATAEIRALEGDSAGRTSIIALTAHSTDQDREACLKAGMDAHLNKPIDLEQLVQVVESSATRSERSSPTSDTDATSGRNVSQDNTFDLPATMKRLGGDEQLLLDFVEVFNEDSPRLLLDLQSAIAQGDSAITARTAHSLRGLAANFGAARVVELAALIENAGTQEDLAQADCCMEQFSQAVAQLAASLNSYRSARFGD